MVIYLGDRLRCKCPHTASGTQHIQQTYVQYPFKKINILDLQAFVFEVFEKEAVNGVFFAAQNRDLFQIFCPHCAPTNLASIITTMTCSLNEVKFYCILIDVFFLLGQSCRLGEGTVILINKGKNVFVTFPSLKFYYNCAVRNMQKGSNKNS